MHPINLILALSLIILLSGGFPARLPAQPVRFFSETLATDPGWITSADWAFGQPTGGGGCHTPPDGCEGVWGYPDPDSGYTGDNVYGYNLEGDYPNNIDQTYYLTTTGIDTRGYRSVNLKFRRWLNVERREHDLACLEVSSDGLNWQQIWSNPLESPVIDSEWVLAEYPISQVADHQQEVRIRWGLGPTDDHYAASGWNIDDIELWGIAFVPGTPTPTPAPTASPSPSLVPTISPTPSVSPTSTPIPTVSATPSVSPSSTPIPTPTPPPTATPTPSVTPTMVPTASPVPSPTPGEPVRIYSFHLDSDPSWTTESAWAFGPPRGGGETSGFYPNPTYAHSGYYVYGFNLSGGYGSRMPPCTLTTNPIDCSDLVKTRLVFFRWLNIERSGLDRAEVQVSPNGTNWSTVWENPAGDWVRDSSWTRREYDISSIADREGAVYIRWVMGPTDEFVNASGWNIDDIEIWGVPANPTPFPTSTAVPTPRSPFPRLDYNGDGTSDIAIFRPAAGLWSVRGVTRAYFGTGSDIPVPGDYNGDGTAEIAVFRESSGLWGVLGVTRAYFGGIGDLPRPAQWRWDGRTDFALFRPATGLWAIRGISRFYFGSAIDQPVEGYYAGPEASAGIFRPETGLWAIRGVTRFYFGARDNQPVPGDYDGLGRWQPAIYRPATGLWAIRGVTRYYFGADGDLPVPGEYGGRPLDRIALFRPATGLWAIRNTTRAYFGASGDRPVSR